MASQLSEMLLFALLLDIASMAEKDIKLVLSSANVIDAVHNEECLWNTLSGATEDDAATSASLLRLTVMRSLALNNSLLTKYLLLRCHSYFILFAKTTRKADETRTCRPL